MTLLYTNNTLRMPEKEKVAHNQTMVEGDDRSCSCTGCMHNDTQTLFSAVKSVFIL